MRSGIGFLCGELALMAWGFYQAIYVAPNDAMQGEIFRIFTSCALGVGGVPVFLPSR